MDAKYPNGESPDDFYKRVKKCFNDIVSKYKYSSENILIVTHSGVIDIICHLVKDINWTNKNKSFKASNVAIYKLSCNCKGKLEFEMENYNDFFWRRISMNYYKDKVVVITGGGKRNW